MPEYSYVSVDNQGRNQKGILNAESKADLQEKLRLRGEYIVSVRENASSQSTAGGKPLKIKDLALFCNQLSKMLNAGVTLVKGLEIICDQTENKRAKQAIKDVYNNVQEGRGLAESMKLLGKTFPPFAVNMIQTGEISGSLDSITSKLAVYYQKDLKTRSKVRSAMIYPIILGAVTVGVVIILLTFVLPNIISQFTSTGTDLPLLTRVLLGISDFLRYRWYIILGVLLILYASYKISCQSKAFRIGRDKFKLGIPKAGKLYRIIIAGRFCRCLYALFSGGTSLIVSLEMAAKVVNNDYIESELGVVKDEVSKGKALSRSLVESGIFPAQLTSLFSVGEQSGSLDAMILETADIYEEESDAAIAALVSMLEPLMIVVMAVVIAFIIIAILQPMYGMLDTIE